MHTSVTTTLVFLLFSFALASWVRAQAAHVTPAEPKWGETLTITYDPSADSARFEPGEEVYAVVVPSRPAARGQVVARRMAWRDSVFTLQYPVEEGLSYLQVHFVTLAEHDPASRLATMIYRPDGRPAPGAYAASMYGGGAQGDLKDVFRKEFELYPDNYAAYHDWWFIQSQADTLASVVRADMERMRQQAEGEPVDLLYVLAYGHLLLGEEPEARALLKKMAERYPTESLTERAFDDYGYQAFSQQLKGEGPDEVERIRKETALRHPESGLARATLSRLARDREAPLDVLETIAESWMRAEPTNPDPYEALALAYLTHEQQLDRAAEHISRAINLTLAGYPRLYGDVSNGAMRWALPFALDTQARIALKREDYSAALGASKLAQAMQTQSEGRPYALEAEVWQALEDRPRAMDAYLAAWRHHARGAEDSLRVLYTAEHGSLDGFDAYLSTAADADEEAPPAPDFTAVALDGTTYDLASLRGKVVVVNFWFVGCAPCRVEIPGLNELVAAFAEEDVVFLAFALDDAEALHDYLAENPFDYAILPEAGDVARQYDVSAYPTHLILDRQGRIVSRLTGGSAERHEDLRPIIERLVKEG